MYPAVHAEQNRDKAAQVVGSTGLVVTYGQLDDRSNQLAQLLWDAGLRPGDHLALFAENHPRYLEVVWAALRSGLYLTTVNRYLTAEEAAYVVDDCGAQALVASAALAEVAEAMVDRTPAATTRLMLGGPGAATSAPSYVDYDEAIARYPARPLAEEPLGEYMLYSSGTTGRPKGISRPRSGRSVAEGHPSLIPLFRDLFGMSADTVYLSPAPLYHSAPLAWSAGVQSLGGTVVVMEHFDPAEALALIERHRVTASQWVPTMFVRMLKLRPEARQGHDLSSHRLAVHAAAPCPVQVKERMIEWWGPILHEYYAGTELNGFTHITSEEWLTHKGSVGRPLLGTIHICGPDGEERPTGEAGTIYFELPEMPFRYHNDPEKTRAAQHPGHPNWSALGDVGYLDDEGYLYLTDRESHMIISGGVNIYPQEIENVLVTHPEVVDVAVIGVPHDEFGEEVKAVVQPVDPAAGPELERTLLAYCRERLAGYKCPRSVDFAAELPRLPTGKLYKRVLKDRYWDGHRSRIV